MSHGMSDGSSLGVLFTGFVHKKNPIHGALKKKFLVLTHVGVHWFKRQPGADLFGEERGCMKLVDIRIVKKTPPKTAGDEYLRMFEITTVDGKHRVFLTETENACDQWVNAIEHAMSNKFRAYHNSQAEQYSKGTNGGTATDAAADAAEEKEEAAVVPVDTAGDKAFVDSVWSAGTGSNAEAILFITVSNKATGEETLISRGPQWGSSLTIPGDMFGSGDSVVITLKNDGVATVKASRQEPLQTVDVFGGMLATEVVVDLSERTRIARVLVPSIGVPLGVGFLLLLLALTFFLTSVLLIVGGPSSVGGVSVESSMELLRALNVTPSSFLLLSALTFILASDLVYRGSVGARRRLKDWHLQLVEHKLKRTTGVLETEQNKIPKRYIDACIGNVAEAYRCWYETCKWRESWKLADLISSVQPHYSEFKQQVIHFIAGLPGKEPHVHPVFYLRPSSLDMDVLRAEGLNSELLTTHFVFVLEYLFTLTAPQDEANAVLLLDLRDVGIKHFMGETFEFWRTMIRIAQEHYPERCEACYCLNPPGMFSFMFRLARAFVNPITMKKVHMIPHHQIDAEGSWILKYCSESSAEAAFTQTQWWKDLNARYCCFDGNSETGTGAEFAEEAELAKFVHELNIKIPSHRAASSDDNDDPAASSVINGGGGGGGM